MESGGDQTEAPAYPAAAFAARLRANAGPAAALGNIDGLCDAVVPGLVLLPPGAPDAWIEAGSTVRASGWALAHDHAPLRGVALALGEAVVVCRYGLARPDVAQYFGRHEAGRSGFSVELDTADFAPGRHRARLLGIDAGGALVAAPASLELHLAALRPAGDFLAVPASASVELELTGEAEGRAGGRNADGRPPEPTAGPQGVDLVVRGRAFDHGAACPFEEVAAVVGTGEIQRGRRTGDRAGGTFEIVIPTAGRPAGMLHARVVALGPSGRAERALPPHLVVPGPPAAFVGLRRLHSPLRIHARTRPARAANGRIDGDRFTIEGYAYDPGPERALRALAFRVRLAADRYYPSGVILWATYGLPRTDDAASGAPPALRNTGFTITVDRRAFGPGEYTVEALAPSRDLRGYLAPQPVTSFDVAEPPSQRAARTLVRVVRASPA